jgi:hypothetical protein
MKAPELGDDSPFLLKKLDGLLKRIDKRLDQLDRFQKDPRVSAGRQEQVSKKITELREIRLGITRLMAHLEKPSRR